MHSLQQVRLVMLYILIPLSDLGPLSSVIMKKGDR